LSNDLSGNVSLTNDNPNYTTDYNNEDLENEPPLLEGIVLY